jgi:hypothetical protein
VEAKNINVFSVKENIQVTFFHCLHPTFRSRDSLVGIVTSYGLDGPGLIPGSARFFSSPQPPD